LKSFNHTARFRHPGFLAHHSATLTPLPRIRKAKKKRRRIP
jgi:hypothetical protein